MKLPEFRHAPVRRSQRKIHLHDLRTIESKREIEVYPIGERFDVAPGARLPAPRTGHDARKGDAA